MKFCKNCKHELIECSKNHYLHAKEINIGTIQNLKLIKTAHQTCPKCNCIYPEELK